MLLDAIIAGFGLSMDAFAVSVTKGLSEKKINIINMLVIAFFFGFFQFAMPVVGYYFCASFSGYIESFDHWIAFVLLVFLGAKMIYECLKENGKTENETFQNEFNKENKNAIFRNLNEAEKNSKTSNENIKGETSQFVTENEKSKNPSNKLKIGELLFLALATSIDALVTGITFAFNGGNIFLSAGLIGLITFAFSCIGFIIGNFFGVKFKKIAEILGGVVLILLGVKFLLEGLDIINFGF